MNDPEPTRTPPAITDLFRVPAMRNYFLIAVAALFIYYTLMVERSGSLTTLLVILIAVPGLTARWVVSPPLVLLLTTYLLFDPGFEGLFVMIQGYPRAWSGSTGWYYGQLDFTNMLLAAAILVYVIAQYRLLSLFHKSMPDDPPPRRKGQPEPTTPRRPARLFTEGELGSMLLLVPLWIAGAALGWEMLAGYERGERLGGVWGITRPFVRFMLFVWFLAMTVMLISVVFRYLALLRMSRREARLLLQDEFWLETRREQERIHRWRRWFRNL